MSKDQKDSTRIVVGFYDDVFNLNNLLVCYPAIINANGKTFEFLLTVDMLIGNIVKLAGNPEELDTESYIEEIKHHVRYYDSLLNDKLELMIRNLIKKIRQIYRLQGLLDEYGSCDLRFNMFVNNFDIQVWRPV